MPKKKKIKKIKSVSFKKEKINYDKVKHVTSVDQSDRQVPYNLRQSGPTKVEMLISTRVRKSPYWHLSMRRDVGEQLFIIVFIIQEGM